MPILNLDVCVPNNAMMHWDSQVHQYEKVGPPGISYFKAVIDEDDLRDKPINCLLYRDTNGILLGILNHYPFDMPPHEKAGDFSIWVDPKHWRKGIGKALLAEANRRYKLNWNQQAYTPRGAALVRAYLKTQRAFGSI